MNYYDLKPSLRAKILMESLSSDKTFRELFTKYWVEKFNPPFVEDIDEDSLMIPFEFPNDLDKHFGKVSYLLNQN